MKNTILCILLALWLPTATPYFVFEVTHPPAYRGIVPFRIAEFGPLYVEDVTNATFLSHAYPDVQACSTLDASGPDGHSFNGSVMLVSRGACAFSTKVQLASAVGAIGVIVYDAAPKIDACVPEAEPLTGTGFNQSTDYVSLLNMQAFQGEVDVPAMFVPYDIGFRLASYVINNYTTNDTDALMRVYIKGVGASGLLAEEHQALITLDETNGHIDVGGASSTRDWHDISDLGRDPCLERVKGIFCEHGRVVGLNLPNSDLSGQLTPQIAKLTHLRFLDLSNNDLTGSLPCEMGNLTRLTTVYLPSNHDVRALAPVGCLGGRYYCEEFLSSPYANDSAQHPEEPVVNCAEVNTTGLTALQLLSVGTNTMEYLPPDVMVLPDLRYLHARNNHIRVFPGRIHLPELRLLDLSYNDINGTLPTMSRFSKLEDLYMQFNQFHGDIAASTFNNMSNLQTLALQGNNFGRDATGNGGSGWGRKGTESAHFAPLPDLIGCSSLVSLDLSANNFGGPPPESWRTSLPELQTLILSFNQIQSPLSPLTGLTKLLSAVLDHNNLTLTIPVSPQLNGDVGPFIVGAFAASIETVDLSHNQLAGIWTTGWTGVHIHLSSLRLSHNNITQCPADIFSYDSIASIDMSNNKLDNQLPTSTWPSRTVQLLQFHDNPNFGNAQLPPYLQPAAAEQIQFAGLSYSCPVIVGNSFDSDAGGALAHITGELVVTLDADYFDFKNCTCKIGFFGVPPDCVEIPSSSVIFVQTEDTESIAPVTMGTRTSEPDIVVHDIASLVRKRRARSQSRPSTHVRTQTEDQADVTVSYGAFIADTTFSTDNGTFSDGDYGDNRFSPGIDTSWAINSLHDVTSSSHSAPTVTDSTTGRTHTLPIFDTRAVPSAIHSAPINVGSLAAKTVLFSFVFNPAEWKDFTDVVAVFIGGEDLKGRLVTTLRGTDRFVVDGSLTGDLSDVSPNPSNVSEVFEVVDGGMLHFKEPYQVDVYAFGAVATLNFRSRDPAGSHFQAQFFVYTQCPPGFEPTRDVLRQSLNVSSTSFTTMAGGDSGFIEEHAIMCQPIPPLFEISESAVVAVSVLGTVTLIMVLTMLFIVVCYRDYSVIRSSSRLFCYLILTFDALLAAGSFLWIVNPGGSEGTSQSHGDFICAGRFWFSLIGVVGVLSNLLVKTYRIHQIFKERKNLKRVTIKDKHILMVSSAMLAIVVILLCILVFGGVVEYQVSRGSGFTEGYRVPECRGNSPGYAIWLGFVAVMLFGILIWGTYLAYQVRNVPSSFNESYYIAVCLGVILLLSALGGSVVGFISSNPDALAVLLGVTQCLLALCVALALFGPKVYYIATGRGNTKPGTTHISTGNTSGGVTGSRSALFGSNQDFGRSFMAQVTRKPAPPPIQEDRKAVELRRMTLDAEEGPVSDGDGYSTSDESDDSVTSLASRRVSCTHTDGSSDDTEDSNDEEMEPAWDLGSIRQERLLSRMSHAARPGLSPAAGMPTSLSPTGGMFAGSFAIPQVLSQADVELSVPGSETELASSDDDESASVHEEA